MAQGLGDLLGAVVAAAARSAVERERRAGRAALERDAMQRTPRGGAFAEGLQRAGIPVIAECKRRSPSRGVLRAKYDPATIASGYARAGAAAISVLTEPTFFDGSLDHLQAVRAAVDVPLLCKDFFVTESQLLEARAAGADAVLLIVAALDTHTLKGLWSTARTLGLAALVEVHDRPELERALDAGADIVGVNSRNLRTLEVNTAVFDELSAHIPKGVVAVAESGLRSGADLARLKALRYDAFLIGERFMTEDDPGRALEMVRAAAERGVIA
jgi:indole-3-glycerol phosphate synthase